MSHHRPLSLALVTTLTAGLNAGATLAAEWSAEPSVIVRGEFDDNIRLTNAKHDNAWGTILDPRLKLSRRSELWDLNASGRVRAARYTGEDGLNTVDNYWDVGIERSLERGSLGATASLTNDTTLQSEVLDLDTGLTVNQIDRSQRDLGVKAQYYFTEATWLEAAVNYSTVSYDQGERYGLLDYTYLTPSLRVIYQYNPKMQLFTILSHSKVDYDAASNFKSRTDSLQLGAAYDITETWKVSASVGGRRTKTSELVTVGYAFNPFVPPFIFPVLGNRDAETTGLVYDASLSREFETGQLKLSASQSVTPSSTGTDTETTNISINGKYDFSAKLSAALAVSYLQASTVGNVTTRADSDHYRIAPSLSWNLDRDLVLTTGYTYTYVKRASTTTTNDTVDSNAAYVSIGYAWPPMAVSR